MRSVPRSTGAWIAGILVGVASLSGCGSVTMVGSPFDPASEVTDYRLIGLWSEDGPDQNTGDCCFAVLPGDAGYRIVLPETDEGVYVGRLFAVGSELFLDLSPEVRTGGAGTASERGRYVLPLHQVVRVGFMGDSLGVALLRRDYVESRIQDGSLVTGRMPGPRGTLVLTDPSEMLVAAMTVLATDAGAWEEVGVLHRQQ